MATASPTIAAVLTAPPGQSSLLSRRASTLAYSPSFYSTASPRAFSGPRPTALVAPIAFPSLRRSGVRLPAAESDAREIEVETASGGDGGSPEGSDPGSGGGAGGDNGKSGGGDSEKSEGGGADEGKKRDHKGGMSMSQKLTLGYAALVGERKLERKKTKEGKKKWRKEKKENHICVAHDLVLQCGGDGEAIELGSGHEFGWPSHSLCSAGREWASGWWHAHPVGSTGSGRQVARSGDLTLLEAQAASSGDLTLLGAQAARSGNLTFLGAQGGRRQKAKR